MFPMRKINQHSGFTLIELLIVLAILGLLAVLLGSSCCCIVVSGDAPRNAALTQLAGIESAIEIYRLDTLENPKTLEGLIKNETDDPRWRGPYLQNGIIPLAPWDNPFQYQRLGPEGKNYDLYSYGADGKLGGGR